jgi:hypothetical protein
MAISWMTVLAAVPWTEVIKNAPKVADGAKKLWNTVGRKDGKDVAAPAVPAADPQARIAVLEQSVAALNAQMQASAEIIKALAEQNESLVQRCELNRRRTLALGVLVLLLLAALIFVAR